MKLKKLKPRNIQKHRNKSLGNHFHQNLQLLCQTGSGFQTTLPWTQEKILWKTQTQKHPETIWKISGKCFSPKLGISMPNWIGFPNHNALNPRKMDLKKLKPRNIQKQMVKSLGKHVHQKLQFLCQTGSGLQTTLPRNNSFLLRLCVFLRFLDCFQGPLGCPRPPE